MALHYRISNASRETSIFGPEEDDDFSETPIEWSNLIFLPFNYIFKQIILFTVIVKCILGPMQAVYCWDVLDRNEYLIFIKYFYWYCCDPIYIIDLFLHIVHRQVTDKAMRREYLPKSALLLVLDFVAVIPFFRLMTDNDCPPVVLWPNILALTEFVLIYRVTEFFSLATTHSHFNLVVGFTILVLCTINCFTCLWLLITKHGLCSMCRTNKMYDWRNNFMHKLNETDQSYTTYVYGAIYILTYLSNYHLDDTKPLTMIEHIVVIILAILGYLILLLIVMPKLIVESILRLRRISAGYPHVKRLIEETKRRNPSPKAYIDITKFLREIWRKRHGITDTPEVIMELPRYLQLDIRQDLGWPLFYHSPTLRKRTIPFKRYLCDFVVQDFLLPGQKFFSGAHTHSNLYYIKSGVVQILSGDEGITPILSVSSGTILGDISFYVPPFHRKVNIKCLTYCDILILSRRDYIRALHKYPEDRYQVLKLAQERLEHAKRLYNCKQNVKGLDRTEDEGISWLKRRWWEISQYLQHWKAKGHKDHAKCELPPEESAYHCAKYIGQLVLCTSTELQTKSLFKNVSFPWILVPDSSFIFVWRKIVLVTVFFVLIIYPPNITKPKINPWFRFFQVCTDLIYIADIGISLLTAVTSQDRLTTNFAYVMLTRCKTMNFSLDLISTIWIEYLCVAIGKSQFFMLSQFNRVIKIYMLFSESYIHWDVKKNPVVIVFLRVILIQFCFWYIASYIIYAIDNNIQSVTTGYFFGNRYCEYWNAKGECDPGSENALDVAISLVVESFIMSNLIPKTVTDMYIGVIFTMSIYCVNVYCLSVFISTIYLSFREVTNYQNFVSNLKSYYKHYHIHKDLLRRLEKYLLCHWKYDQGSEVMKPNTLKHRPYEIYLKVQGEVAEKIIGESKTFEGADPGLIRDLAYSAKFLILPNKSTIFLFGVPCQNVTWIVQGQVKCEYHNEEGDLLKEFYGAGCMLSVSSVFMGQNALKTYVACTDCEILYIHKHEFFKIIQRYPNEWLYLETCVSEFKPIFDEMLHSHMKKHIDYQRRLRQRIFHARRSTSIRKFVGNIEHEQTLATQQDFWTTPRSDFIEYWLLFRTAIAIISIANASLQGGSGAIYRRHLIIIGAFCNCVGWVDIFLKLFLAYYDSRGLLIYDKKKCVINYISRGFWLDLLGSIPRLEILRYLRITDNTGMLLNTVLKFSHLHIVFGYFNYIGDVPMIHHTYIMIGKWLVVAMLAMLGTSHYLMSYCVNLTFNKYGELNDLVYLNTCWIPKTYILENRTMEEKLHLIYAESLHLAQCGVMGSNFGKIHIDRGNISVTYVILIMAVMFWYVTGYALTLLVLNSRGNTLFQHGVNQLRSFLKSERVDKKLIDKASAHFIYWWTRTKGINVHHLTQERIGKVLRQDLTYFFYRRTFLALETLLHAGHHIERELANVSSLIFLLPNEEVIREMDLTSSVYVVHRGKVIVTENGEELNSLTKGSIFGQLTGTKSRPVRISAKCEGHTDLLQININQFQGIINDDIREIISHNPQSRYDYMATHKVFKDHPYRSIKYILRGRQTILLPFMRKPMEASQGNPYARWLYIAWLVQPSLAATLVLTLMIVKPYLISRLYWVLGFLDLIHFVNFLFGFFTVNSVIVDNRCIQRTMGYRRMKSIDFYCDFLSLIMPPLTYWSGHLGYQLFRLLRLKYLYNFHQQFCKSFKSKSNPVILKAVILFLLLHSAVSSWIALACKSKEFPSGIVQPILPPNANLTIDYTEWVLLEVRQEGCLKIHHFPNVGAGFVVPLSWYYDYVVAMVYIILLYIHSTVYAVTMLTIQQLYFKLVITGIMYFVNTWLTSVTISFVTTRFRELYQYDYSVSNLFIYLSDSGLSHALLDTVKDYTKQLWRRQSGSWLPELVQSAPICLREDLFGALYIHHLETPPLLRVLPHYFKRQLAARLKRIVLFPGKCIVQEGDIYPCIYFIHEGEVEKFYVDKSGENKFLSILSTNGFFGSMAGLFPNFAFQFSYYSRTVVDLVYLRLSDWQDLLDGYPDIKLQLYTSATKFRENAKR